jgi:hypothetical protein
MSKIFISQNAKVRDQTTGAFRDKFNFSKAFEHGDKLVEIFGSGQMGLTPEATTQHINLRLDEENFDPAQDYLIATGDMCLGIQVAVLMLQRGGCRLLRWANREQAYTIYKISTGDYVNER